MEGSDAAQAATEKATVGQSGEDLMKAQDNQQPIGEDPGGVGTVTPRSAPPAQEAVGEAAAGDGHDEASA